MKYLLIAFIFLNSCDVRTDDEVVFIVKSVEYLDKGISKGPTQYYENVFLYNDVITSNNKFSIGDTLELCKK